jgi:polyhydroxyalkanoate synthesis regulator phasin
MRSISVSDRMYNFFKFGSEVYGESIANFIERLVDASMSRQEEKELISHVKSEISQISHTVESDHSQLIKDALSLIGEFSSEKAKELEERLAQIKSQISHVE